MDYVTNKTFVDRVWSLNGKRYLYQKKGENPLFLLPDPSKATERDCEKVETLLYEILPNGERKLIATDTKKTPIVEDILSKSSRERWNRKTGEMVDVIEWKRGTTDLTIGKDGGTSHRICAHGQGNYALIGRDIKIDCKKSFGDAVKELENCLGYKHINKEYIERQIAALKDLGENSYNQLVRYIRKFKV